MDVRQVPEAELARSYGEAWNNHDVDALLRHQSEDMRFTLHVEGFDSVAGVDALRDLYGFFFQALPDYRAEVNATLVGDRLIVLQYVIHATLATPFPIGHEVGTPTGQPIAMDAVDVITTNDAALVRTKDTYLDGFALRRGFGLTA